MTKPMHCDHECVCNKYIDYTNTGATPDRICNGETWMFKPCPHDTRARGPAQQTPEPFCSMASPDLIALAEKEWLNRAERKQPLYDKRSWISGWFDGYFSKPKSRQKAPATSRNMRCNCDPKAKGDDTDPEICKQCLRDYQRAGCSCLDMHDSEVKAAVLDQLLNEIESSKKCGACNYFKKDCEGVDISKVLCIVNSAIETFSQSGQNQPSTAIEDITPEGAAIIQSVKEAERERLIGFHSELKAESEIELIEEQKELTEGLKEALCIFYRWFPELKISGENKIKPLSPVITDMEGDPVGFCSDCEAHHEGFGEKLPCGKDHDDQVREEGAKSEREKLLKSLQKCLDDPDTHEGCDFGTVSVAKIVMWMSAWGYDCD